MHRASHHPNNLGLIVTPICLSIYAKQPQSFTDHCPDRTRCEYLLVCFSNHPCCRQLSLRCLNLLVKATSLASLLFSRLAFPLGSPHTFQSIFRPRTPCSSTRPNDFKAPSSPTRVCEPGISSPLLHQRGSACRPQTPAVLPRILRLRSFVQGMLQQPCYKTASATYLLRHLDATTSPVSSSLFDF